MGDSPKAVSFWTATKTENKRTNRNVQLLHLQETHTKKIINVLITGLSGDLFPSTMANVTWLMFSMTTKKTSWKLFTCSMFLKFDSVQKQQLPQ